MYKKNTRNENCPGCGTPSETLPGKYLWPLAQSRSDAGPSATPADRTDAPVPRTQPDLPAARRESVRRHLPGSAPAPPYFPLGNLLLLPVPINSEPCAYRTECV